MQFDEFLRETDLERTLLVGFYGGGNYGDELLLEVLLNLFRQKNIQSLTIAHRAPGNYPKFHHDFGYPCINMQSPRELIGAVLKARNIVIGGGGLWGRDVNLNVFLLSVILFMSRYLLRKRVYLLGVGYYNTTPALGRVGAWFAGRAANFILARDIETKNNFLRTNKNIGLDNDIATALSELDLKEYDQEAKTIEGDLGIKEKNIFVTIRRLHGDFKHRIEELISSNPEKHFIVMILEPKEVDPGGYENIIRLSKQYSNVTARDYDFNPAALYRLFKRNSAKFILIGPQFHIIITAFLANVPFMPIVYDNKVQELLEKLAIRDTKEIHDVSVADLQAFVDKYYAKGAG